MGIIKLNAIDSTNSFLKEMVQKGTLKNGITVVAKKQLQGRGQMGTQWVSEAGKNLLCSVFFSFDNLPISNQFYLNYVVSLSIFEVLKKFNLPKLRIKWANDILSENHKLCGILIENVVKNKQIKYSVIGIGLNVNQKKFGENLQNASSIIKITKKETNIEVLLNDILLKLKANIELLVDENFEILEKRYLKVLYKKNIPAMFKNSENVLFMGIIVGVTPLGKLQIKLDDDTVKEFGIKEVSFL